MPNIDSPLDHFLIWFESLPPDHQKEIASFASFLPGFGSVLDTEDISLVPQRFVEKVRSYQDGKTTEKAAAVALHYYVGPELVEQRASGDWRTGQANLREVIKETGYRDLEYLADSAEFRNQQWLATRDKWRRLVQGPFSIEAIRGLR